MLSRLAAFSLLVVAFWLSSAPVRGETVTIVCGSSPPAVELCRQGAAAWGKARGHEARVLGMPEASMRARALLAELLAAGVTGLDAVEVDLVWPVSLAPYLLDLTDRLPGAGPFFAGATRSFSVEGRLLAAPWSLSVGQLFYRRDLLERYRLPVPATWEELVVSARQVQDGERAAGRNDLWGYVWQARPGEGLTVNALEWLAGRGIPPVIEAGGVIAGLARPEAAAALDQATSWIDTVSPGSVLAMDGPQSLEVFAAGNAAFLRHWSNALPLLEAEGSAVRGRVASAALPGGAGVLGGHGLAVAKASKFQDLALDLVRWLTAPEEQKRRALAGGHDPSLPALYDDPELRRRWPHLADLRAAIDRAVLRPAEAAGGGYDALSEVFARSIHAILSRQVEAGPGLRALADSLRRLDAVSQRAGS